MRKIWINVLILVASAVIISLIILLLIRFTPEPPVGETEHAREALSRAMASKADQYSKKHFNQAKVYYDSAMMNWKKENRRFLYFRDYGKVVMFTELSVKKANQATENSTTSTTNLKINIVLKIDTLTNLVSEINKLFATYPLTAETRNRISKGKMLLEEAEIAYKKEQYLQANRKITDSEYLLTSSYENATTNLKNYFTSYSIWNNWINKTINESKRNHDYSIIIDKFSRKCFVYHNGAKKFEFEAELGLNWVGDKRIKGDKATPEGMYKITKKFEGGRTKYYKALLLDYPNDEDTVKFRSEIANGSLPASSKIGELIEIHGNGGKGIDWTEGCVALTDKEMDVVFKIAKVGTPVTIVGSTVDLQNVINK